MVIAFPPPVLRNASCVFVLNYVPVESVDAWRCTIFHCPLFFVNMSVRRDTYLAFEVK